MNVSEAISFVFEDEEWASKLLLGAVVSIIPLFGWAALTGYAIAVLRNAEAGRRDSLPSWDKLGEYFVDGLVLWVAMLIYSIPLLVFVCPIAIVWALPIAAGDNQDLTMTLTSIAGLVSAGLGCLVLLYALLLWVLWPVLKIRYAETGQLTACLGFAEVFRFLFRHIGSIIIAQLLVWVAALVIMSALGGVIGVIALVPICGWVVASFLGLLQIPVGVWLVVFAADLYGQIGRAAGADRSPA